MRHLESLSRAISAPTPLSHASDQWLADELAKLSEQWDASRGSDPEDEGAAGSPGEWMWERMGEIETEQKRRRATSADGED